MKTDMYLNMVLPIALLLLLVSSHLNAQKRCEQCARHSMLVEFLNPHNPDYEKQLDAWQECTKKYLGDQAYLNADTLDPAYKDAIMKCKYLDPPNKWCCYPSMMETYLGERLTNPCFHMLSPIVYDPQKHKPPEYIFKGSYEAGLEGGRIIEYFEDYKKPVIARMKCELYYNGNTPILVQEWFSENTINDPKALFNKLKMPKNISPVLEEFEGQPVKCEVKIPAPEEICENGTGEIELSGFVDETGNTSKSFNRIIVSIYKGEILNGENSDFGPDWKVFTVGEGAVKVRYRPPEDKDDGWEWLRVYNSCEILPAEKSPMSGTQMDSIIVDQHFPISCGFYEGTITVTKRCDYTKRHDDYSETLTGKQSVTYNGIFKPIPLMEGMEGQPIKMFGKGTAQGTWKHNEQRYCEGNGCGECTGLVYEEYGSGSMPSETMDGLVIITNVWPTDEKKVADQVAHFGMENWYDITTPTENVQTENRTKSYTSDGGCQWHNSSSTTNLIGADVRFKLTDIMLLNGSVSWSSTKGTTIISATDMTEAIYDQKPFDPEKDGNDYTYTIKWNLKAL